MLAYLLLACAAEVEATPSAWTLTLTNVSAPGDLVTSAGPADVALAPGVFVVHDPAWALLSPGRSVAGGPLEALAEDGAPHSLLSLLEATEGVYEAGLFSDLEEGGYREAAMPPGGAASIHVELSADQRLSVALMFGQSNDVLVAALSVAPPAGGGELPLSLWDVGTELNQEPGAGADQAPRQAAANTGAEEEAGVYEISGEDAQGWSWPDPATFVRLEATPR
jgi:hypothetical protein